VRALFVDVACDLCEISKSNSDQSVAHDYV
jgi:hypothetical protein